MMKRLIAFALGLAAIQSPVVAQVAISNLPSATTPLSGTEPVPCVQAGVTKKCLTGSLSQAGTQTANTVLAAPSGSSGAPAFRALQTADIPTGTSGAAIPVLNGANTWSGVQSHTATDNVIVTTNPTGDGANRIAQNSRKTAYNIYSPVVPGGYYYWDSTRSVVDLETGTTVTNANAFGAYTYNALAQGTLATSKNAVGLFTSGIDAVDYAATWGINTTCNDNTTNGAATLTGRKCIGYEADFTDNGASTIQGISELLQGVGTPANAAAVGVDIVSGSTAKWTAGYFTGDNSIATGGAAFSVGALTYSAASIASQTVSFNYYNASSVRHAATVQSASNGSLLFKSNEYNDGVAVVPGNSNVYVLPTGSDTNINLNLQAGGTAGIVIQSPVSGSVSITGSNFAGTGTATFAVNANAGTGATAVCKSGWQCNGVSGTITLTTGSGTAAATQLTVTTPQTRILNPTCIVQGYISNAVAPLFSTNESTNSFQIVAASALTASTVYTINYHCMGI